MAKVAALVANEEMRNMIDNSIKKYEHINLICNQKIEGKDLSETIRRLEKEGVELIIARGTQAMLIKDLIKCPIIEIRLTDLDLIKLIEDNLNKLNIQDPKVAFVGASSMLLETKDIEKYLGIKIRFYLYDSVSLQSEYTKMAVADGNNLIIGGTNVCLLAKQLGVNTCHVSASSPNGIEEALYNADKLCYAIDIQKQRSAEVSALFEYSFQGIIQLDKNGIIKRINSMVTEWAEMDADQLINTHISTIFPAISEIQINQILYSGDEIASLMLDLKHYTLVANLTPIKIDEEITGISIALQEFDQIFETSKKLKNELSKRTSLGFNLDNFVCSSNQMKEILRLSKKAAHYSVPVLITEPVGCEGEFLANAIHNSSSRSEEKFTSIDCSAFEPCQLNKILFGNDPCEISDTSLIFKSESGTILLKNVEHLSLESQYRIEQVILGNRSMSYDIKASHLNTRVMASTCIDLVPLIKEGKFRYSLYHMLSTFSISIPPLNSRKEDIGSWTSYFLKNLQREHHRYVRLPSNAKDLLMDYYWHDNLLQLFHVCNKIVIQAEKRNITKSFVEMILRNEAYSEIKGVKGISGLPISYQDDKAILLRELLTKYNGNREAIAKELGISKTTLWRWMKKYGYII